MLAYPFRLMMSLTRHLRTSTGAKVAEGSGQRLALESPEKVLQSCVYVLRSPYFASRRPQPLQGQHTTGRVCLSTSDKNPWRRTGARRDDKHGPFDSPTPIRAGSQEQTNPAPHSHPSTSPDEGVVEDTKSETSIQGVVRPLVLFLALRTGCEILGLRLVAELSGQPVASLDPNLKVSKGTQTTS